MKCPKCKTENPSDSKYCKECATPLPTSEESSVSPTKTLETPKEELTTGSTFAGRYQILEKLGKGGMGRVYKALDQEINEEVAIKLLKPEIAEDEQIIERFRNELKLARKIAHRNVCKMYHLAKEEEAPYITMEFVEGEDLKSLVRKKGKIPKQESINIAKQVCEGLAEAHRLGVVHRDLKPQNIMINKEGNAKIMDFGIARSVEAPGVTQTGVMIGTPEYISPEQAEGEEADQRSDIYSLGVILYEMVTGSVPFKGHTALSVALKHKAQLPQDPRKLNPDVPEDLSRLILICMEKDRERRYQKAEELLNDLMNIEEGFPIGVKVLPRRRPYVTTLIRKKLFMPAFFVALAIIGVVIWQLLPQKEALLAPKIENSIAVISFENLTGDRNLDDLGKAIPNLLITNLENSGYFYVVTWERMHDLLKQLGKDDVEIIESELGFELCRREGVEALVVGSITKAGDMFATDVKVLDVESKRLLKSANSKSKGEGSILATQIDELSKEISLGMGIGRQRIKTAPLRIADITTTSMEAYKYFQRGREELEEYYWDEARKFFEKAVKLDTTFATAYLYLGYSYDALRNTKAKNEAYEKAKSFSQKATEKERLIIEAYYAQSIERNPEKRFRILKQIAKKYPNEKQIYLEMGYDYGDRRNWNKAIEMYNKALELDPYYGDALNSLAIVYCEIDNFDKSVEYFKKYAAVSPDKANPLDSMAWTYFLMGRLDEAIAKYKEVLEIKPDFYFSNEWLPYIYALKEDYAEAAKRIDKFITVTQVPGFKAESYYWKGFYYYWVGSFERSLSDLSKAEDLWKELGNDGGVASLDRLKGWIYYDRGELELCQRHYKSWLDYAIENMPQKIPDITADYNFFLGIVDLKERRIDSARSRLAEMKSLLPKLTPFLKNQIIFKYDLLQGEVLLAEGSPDKAIAVLEKASPLGKPPLHGIAGYNMPFLKDTLASAHLQNEELGKAIAEYERLIKFDPNSKERLLIHPKYHYRLAKLYEQKGWKGKAIEHYDKFLDIWRDADPGMAEVEDARKRIAGLKVQ